MKLLSIKITIFLLVINYPVFAQNLEWAKAFGNNQVETAKAIATDVNGNVYTIGEAEGVIDLDPGPNVFNLNGNGNWEYVYIQKLDKDGNFIWAKELHEVNSFDMGLVVDADSNIYISGYFNSPADFDLGSGTFNVNTGNVFILKLNSMGDFVWVKTITASGNETNLEVDKWGNIYLAGHYNGYGTSTDFDPGVGVYSLTSSDPNYDVYILKLDSSGNFIWAKSVGGYYGHDYARAIKTDTEGNVYCLGEFMPNNNTDFDPGPGVHSIQASGNSSKTDIFVLKLDSSGNFIWAKGFGGSEHDYASDLVLGPNHEVYTIGDFAATVDFDPGVGVINQTSNAYHDIFIHKMDSGGNFVWVKTLGGVVTDQVCSIQMDKSNDLYIAGTVYGQVDFDTDNASLDILALARDYFILKLDDTGSTIWARVFGGGSDDYTRTMVIDSFNNIYMAGTFQQTVDFDPGSGTFLLSEIPNSANPEKVFIQKLSQGKVWGQIFIDLNQDCILDANEPTIEGQSILIHPIGLYSTTDEFGIWTIDSLPVGTYTVEIDTSGLWRPSNCVISFDVTNANEPLKVNPLGIYSIAPCPAPDLAISAPFMRPGFTNQRTKVRIGNKHSASDILLPSQFQVTLDDAMSVEYVGFPNVSLGNNIYNLTLGALYPGEYEDFVIYFRLDSTELLGKTLCSSIEMLSFDTCVLDTIPNTTGISCSSSFDNSHLDVTANCNGGDILFSIKNNGVGAMNCLSQVRLYLDGTIILLDTIQLNVGDSLDYVFTGDGRTWRMEVDQHPLHPGNSRPSATIELCGNSMNWTPGLVNVFPQDDADPIIDIYCGEVTGSYDPNDKTGFPLGQGILHDIEQNQDLEYLIRFQNTGTDTAFTVIIRDTLPNELDIYSIEGMTSTHEYSFRIYGPRVLEWRFDNIMLPDSNINYEGSQGSVRFKINQVMNLPIGTTIENSAGIYFDFNPPIITNTTLHTIDSFTTITLITDTISSGDNCISYTFNGNTYNQSGVYYHPVSINGQDSIYVLDVDILTDTTVLRWGSILTARQTNANYQWLDCDNGLSPILGATDQSFTPTANGNYAVEITSGSCTITSSCYNITNVNTDIIEKSNISLFPNPTKDELVIDFGDWQEDATIKIFSLDGRLLNQFSSIRDQQTTISLGTYPEGLYLIEVQLGAEVPQTFKVVKW